MVFGMFFAYSGKNKLKWKTTLYDGFGKIWYKNPLVMVLGWCFKPKNVGGWFPYVGGWFPFLIQLSRTTIGLITPLRIQRSIYFDNPR